MRNLESLFPRGSKSFFKANDFSMKEDGNHASMGDLKDRRPRGMNKTESEFALILESQKRRGEIRDYLFHPFKLPWGLDPDTGKPMYYEPDFMVTPNSGAERRKMVETKGGHIHYRQQAVARFKGARSYWPEFDFEMIQKTKEGWKQIL
jgi:hypothetical protein